MYIQAIIAYYNHTCLYPHLHITTAKMPLQPIIFSMAQIRRANINDKMRQMQIKMPNFVIAVECTAASTLLRLTRFYRIHRL